MKPLLKPIIILLSIFLLIFLSLNLTGLLTEEDLGQLMKDAHSLPVWLICLLVVGLLTADILLPVPCIVLVSLSGYFLGPLLGGAMGTLGLLCAGCVGYWTSYCFGPGMLEKIYKNEAELEQLKRSFTKHSRLILLLCRAAPMLPEAVSCLAGATKTPFLRYLIPFAINCAVYSLIVAYAGSVSNIDNPRPAILAYLTITGIFWATWVFVLRKRMRVKINSEE